VIGVALSEAVTINAPLLLTVRSTSNVRWLIPSHPNGSHEMFVGKILHVHAEASIAAPDGSIDFAAANLL